MIESARNRLEFQCRTREPGKWPPTFMAVTPGRMVCVGVVIRVLCGFVGESGRQSQMLSSVER
jgi:hypothetical protein